MRNEIKNVMDKFQCPEEKAIKYLEYLNSGYSAHAALALSRIGILN